MQVHDVTEVTTLRLTGIDEGGEIGRLDPITVSLENYKPGQGKITIECFGKSWTARWGAMGDQTVQDFFLGCDRWYIAKNLSNLHEEQPKTDGYREWLAELLVERTKEGSIPLMQSQKLREQIEEMDDCVEGNEALISQVAGADWWDFLPTEPNPDYEYLTRIILAVQAGLRQWKEKADVVHTSE